MAFWGGSNSNPVSVEDSPVGFSASVTPWLKLQWQLTEEFAQAPSQAAVGKQQLQQQVMAQQLSRWLTQLPTQLPVPYAPSS